MNWSSPLLTEWKSYQRIANADPTAPMFSDTAVILNGILATANHVYDGRPGDVYWGGNNTTSSAATGRIAGASQSAVDGSTRWVKASDQITAYRVGWGAEFLVAE